VNLPKTTKNHIFFFLQNKGSRVIYSEKITLRLSAHLEGPLATLLMSGILDFSQFKFGHIFEGLLGPRFSWSWCLWKALDV